MGDTDRVEGIPGEAVEGHSALRPDLTIGAIASQVPGSTKPGLHDLLELSLTRDTFESSGFGGKELTSQQEQIELREKLSEVLGTGPAATLMSMQRSGDELATKAELYEVRDELKGEIAGVRTEVGFLRQEMELKYATKDDLFAAFSSINESINAQTRTFIIVQAATLVGMSGILYGFLRLG